MNTRLSEADSELTARAREVLAGLSLGLRERLRNACVYLDTHGGGIAPMRSTRGLRDLVHASVRGWVRVTALGREVARLLGEEVGRG